MKMTLSKYPSPVSFPKVVWVLVFLSILLTTNLLAQPLAIEVEAKSAILMNADTGRVLFEKKAYEPAYPASTTKVASALYILEQKKPSFEKLVTPSYDCLLMNDPKLSEVGIRKPTYRLDYDGTTMGIKKGETLSVEALMHGIMLVSGNDASNTMAEAVSGSVETFVEELNTYVQSLGCRQTHFCNPHGLHHPEHVTTPYDLAIIMQRALQLPQLRKIMATKSYTCPLSNKQPARDLIQGNRLIRQGKYYYAPTIGGKTGYHSKAQNALVVAAEKEGRTLIAVLMGCKTRSSRFEDAIALFKAAFEEAKERRLMVRAESSYSRAVEGASSPLTGVLKEDLYLEFYPSEEPNPKAFVYWNEISLPLAKGDHVGEIRVVDEKQKVISSAFLYAYQDVKKTFFTSVMDLFKGIFSSKKSKS